MPPRASAAEKGKGPAPATKRGAKRGAGDDDHLTLAELLARCTRADLEALLLEHEDDLPDLRSAVEAKLKPEQRKKSRPQAAPVADDKALVSSGPFAQFDVELTLRILLLLDMKDRLLCVSEVCKGWRSLRRNPALWRTLPLSAPAFSSAGLLEFVTGARSPLPSPGCVEVLELRGDKKFDAKAFKAVLKTLSSATSVTLSGKKLSKDCVAVLTKPRAAPLRALKLSKLSDAEAAVLDLLAAAPQLETLEFDGAVSDIWVDAAGARARAARSGGMPLLTKLAVGRGGGWSARVSVSAFGRLGPAFPELAELHVEELSGSFAAYASPLRDWAPMPALRSLVFANVGSAFMSKYVADAPLQDFLKHVATAAPNLRVLRFGIGIEYLSHTQLKAGSKFVALAAIGGPDLAGIGALKELEELELHTVHVTAADAAGAALPKLRRLTLRNCGTHAVAAAAAIAAAAPRLESMAVWGVVRTGIEGESGPGVSGLAELASESLQELQINTSYGRDYMFERTQSVKEKAADIGSQLRGLAQRAALPALRSLVVGVLSGTAFPLDTFDAKAPWQRLAHLELGGLPPDNAAAVVAKLRAPSLRSLSLPGLSAGFAVLPGPSSHACATPALCAAYEKLRTDGHAPLLPPLRYRDAAAPAPAAEAPADDEEGAGAGRHD